MNKLVLVSGAGRGLGASIAESFVNSGYKVAINYFNSAKEAEDIAKNLFGAKKIDDRLPSYEIKSSFITNLEFSILDALEKLNLSKSRSDTKRLIKSKGIKINEEIYTSNDLSLKMYGDKTEIKISVGKKNIGILKIKK